MEDGKPENPQAFPSKEIDFQESSIQCRTVYQGENSGLSLRDYFAAKAMQGLSSLQDKGQFESIQDAWGEMSEMSYDIADAMLKQRLK